MSLIEYESKRGNARIYYSDSANNQSVVICDMFKQITGLSPSYVAIDVECNPKDRTHVWIGITDGDKTWLFWIDDCTELKELLIKILEHNTLIKVFHDFEADKRLLSPWIKFEAKRVFDTQLAALIKSQPLAMDDLCNIYDVGKKTKAKNNHQDLWSKFVLSEEEREYLTNDVRITHKLARAVLYGTSTISRNRFSEFDSYVEEVIAWLVHKEGRPSEVSGLIVFLMNSSPITKYVSGKEREELAIKITDELKNRRIITVSSVGKVIYTVTDELAISANKKLRPFCCMNCDQPVKKQNGICGMCTSKLKLINRSCDSCNSKFRDITVDGIFCLSCFEYGAKKDCSLCKVKVLEIFRKGVGCKSCYVESDKKELEPEKTKEGIQDEYDFITISGKTYRQI